MSKKSVAIFLLTLTLVGCVSTRSYIGVEPINPQPGIFFGAPAGESKIPIVDSIMPLLVWKDVGADGFTYDVAIWERPADHRHISATSMSRNELIYLKEGITANRHKIERPLKFDTVYMWSVRTRSGEEAGAWSVYKETTIHSFGSQELKNISYSFKTPKGKEGN